MPIDFRAAVAHLASHDPELRRFGARHHRYRVGAPLGEARLAQIEATFAVRFPDDYRAHVAQVGDGGAGPYHGLLPLDHPAQLAVARGRFDPKAKTSEALFHGVVGLAHLGCSYMALLVVDRASPAFGQVWLDALASDDGVFAIAPSFTAFVEEWLRAALSGEAQRAFTTPGNCALPSALTAYLRSIEEQHGVPPGALAPHDTREALAAIPDGGIATTSDGDGPFFAAGDLVDLCPICDRTVENLCATGMRRAQVKPGLSPIPMRAHWP